MNAVFNGIFISVLYTQVISNMSKRVQRGIQLTPYFLTKYPTLFLIKKQTNKKKNIQPNLKYSSPSSIQQFSILGSKVPKYPQLISTCSALLSTQLHLNSCTKHRDGPFFPQLFQPTSWMCQQYSRWGKCIQVY